MKIVVTGGTGFVGSHVAEFYAKQGNEVVAYDNLSRAEILGKADKRAEAVYYNWNYLKENYANIELVKGSVKDYDKLADVVKDADAIIHTAAQVAVTSSVENPREDFEINAMGTFNVLEAARNANSSPAVVYCSTNKVYGENVNDIEIEEGEKRYSFKDAPGVSESLSIDLCEHTPYGCSKLTGDLYVQDYARLYGIDSCVFRMSCIYGTRQFGNEDQGWVAHFIIHTLLGKPLTIFGDGKQVRDVLYVEDLVNAYDLFLQNRKSLRGEVFNTGGGSNNTLSLLELLDLLEEKTGKRSEISFGDWRPSDQKVYISDINKAKEKLGWEPKVTPEEGVSRFIDWFSEAGVF